MIKKVGILGLLSVLVGPWARASSEIDRLVEAGWAAKSVRPAETSSDAEFARRLFLDLTGKVPSADEARAFIESRASDKRALLVEKLLASPDFARYWARKWTVVLFGRKRTNRLVDRREFEEWLEKSLATGKSWAAISREILTASGNPVENPPLNYLLSFEMRREDVAESVASRFMGVQLGCARCHTHPYEPWTQDDFFGVAATFAQMERAELTRADRSRRREYKRTQREVEERKKAAKEGGDTMSPAEMREARREMADAMTELRSVMRIVDDPTGTLEAQIGATKRVVPAKLLDGTLPRGNPRTALADWLASPGNPYFAPAFVNRVWGDLFGRGVVDPVDAFGKANPPSHPELLSFLARDFEKSGYDIRHLVRTIVSSKTYQLSSGYRGELPAPEHFAVARLRRMTPEQLFASLLDVAGAGEVIKQRSGAEFEERKEHFFRQFVVLFETDAVNDEEVAQGTIPQALTLLNGMLTNARVPRRSAPETRSESERVDELFLSVLARFPEPEEKRRVVDYLKSASDAVRAYEDARWALVNTSEFIFVH